jgi:hypothetical protein
MTNILSTNEDAQRLRTQTKSLGEFLMGIHYAPPNFKRKALLHGHCHQKAMWGMSAEQKLLSKMGVEADLLDSGCCGLAGSFGYEDGHYDVSMKIGEHVLLPKVRQAARDTLILSDGFSCREQIMHGTRRHGMHIAELIQMAMHQPLPPMKKYVEEGWVQPESGYPLVTAAATGLLVTAGITFWKAMKNGSVNGAAKTASAHEPSDADSGRRAR